MDLSIQKLFRVHGKVVLVTGGGRGIGKMIAEGFVQNGCTVYIASRDMPILNQVAAELTAKGPGTCFPIEADLSNAQDISRLVSTLRARESKLHVLVNNSGAVWAAPIDTYTDEAFTKIMRLNVHSVFNLTRELLGLLRNAALPEDPARVINIGSINGITPPGFQTFAYSASKAAVHMLTRHLAKFLGEEHITVNAIACGSFDTKMMAFVLKHFADSVKASVPLGRIGEPSDVAGTCLWLASKAGAYVNGSVVVLDGGANDNQSAKL